MPSPVRGKQEWAFGLLGILMVSHLAFLGFGAKHCADMAKAGTFTDQCANATSTFQRAAETYVAILLALMAPTPGKG